MLVVCHANQSRSFGFLSKEETLDIKAMFVLLYEPSHLCIDGGIKYQRRPGRGLCFHRLCNVAPSLVIVSSCSEPVREHNISYRRHAQLRICATPKEDEPYAVRKHCQMFGRSVSAKMGLEIRSVPYWNNHRVRVDVISVAAEGCNLIHKTTCWEKCSFSPTFPTL